MAAKQNRKHDQRDDGEDLEQHAERTGQREEAALHRGADPKVLVPGHARRQLHEMADADAERQSRQHDHQEANEPD